MSTSCPFARRGMRPIDGRLSAPHRRRISRDIDSPSATLSCGRRRRRGAHVRQQAPARTGPREVRAAAGAARAPQPTSAQRNQRIIAAVVVTALVLGTAAWVVLTHQSGPAAEPPPRPARRPVPFPRPRRLALLRPAARPLPRHRPPVGQCRPRRHLNCKEPGTARTDVPSFSAAPTTGTATSITLTTNCGDIVIAVDPKAPKTVASEAFLAKSGFYDNTVVPSPHDDGIFVLQCGDPKGDGTGGPGYTRPRREPAQGRRQQLPRRDRGHGERRARARAARSSSSSTRTRACRATTRSGARSPPVSTSSRTSQRSAPPGAAPTALLSSRCSSNRQRSSPRSGDG